jgi:hypothetical protein
MSYGERKPPSLGNVIAGIFLVLLALCLIFAGGGCTVMLFAMGGGGGDIMGLLLISLGVLAGGLVAGWFGVRLIIGRYE